MVEVWLEILFFVAVATGIFGLQGGGLGGLVERRPWEDQLDKKLGCQKVDP